MVRHRRTDRQNVINHKNEKYMKPPSWVKYRDCDSCPYKGIDPSICVECTDYWISKHGDDTTDPITKQKDIP